MDCNVPNEFLCHPTVCAVGDIYQVLLPVRDRALVSVFVSGREFCSADNGVRLSDTPIHRICIPMALLDAAGSYTVAVRKEIERRPYHPEFAPEQRYEYPFTPLTKQSGVRLYHLADAHGAIDEAAACALADGGTPDLLVLNGDIADSSATPEDVLTTFEITSRVCAGSRPVVIARGNHDMRGRCAETLSRYFPTRQGAFYYTFRLGCVWGVVLDCAEDKADDHPEYGGTLCCHEYRTAQTAFLKDVIRRAAEEFDAPGVKYRLVIAHHPFCHALEAPFDIEQDVYREWCALLKDGVGAQLMLSGHLHRTAVAQPGGRFDQLGQPCALLIGSDLRRDAPAGERLTGMRVELDDGRCRVTFNTAKYIREQVDFDIWQAQ